MHRTLKALAAAALLLAPWLAASAQDKAPERAITQIAGDLYRFQNQFHYSVFLVTPEGIIATDPINAEAAGWLKAELAKRFPDKPIKYLIYSHSHADHISGGEALADGATVVAHARAKERIEAEKVPTAVPTATLTDRKTIELGGKKVELIFLGPNHSDNLIVMHFPAERTLFAVDIVAPKRLPYRDFPDAYIDNWITSLKTVEGMDFDILAPGHGPLGGKADVAEHRQYIEKLRDQVSEQIKAGKSVDEAKQAVTMADYQDWGSYKDWRELNVEGMYRYLQANPPKN